MRAEHALERQESSKPPADSSKSSPFEGGCANPDKLLQFYYSEGFSTGKEAPSEMLRTLLDLSKQKESSGAGRGSRTPKTRRSADFESAASASSAIPALRGSAWFNN